MGGYVCVCVSKLVRGFQHKYLCLANRSMAIKKRSRADDDGYRLYVLIKSDHSNELQMHTRRPNDRD